MKQFQFVYDNEEKLRDSLRKIKQIKNSSLSATPVFKILANSLDINKIRKVVSIIRDEMPDAPYVGSTTYGNIVMGDFNRSDIAIICTMYEYSTTRVRVLQYPLTAETVSEVTSQILNIALEESWVNHIEILTTIEGLSMSSLCNDLSILAPHIQLTGGGAFSKTMVESDSFVFSSEGDVSYRGIVFTLTGGEDYYAYSSYISGWNPLGRNITVTKADERFLNELDGKPAYDTYYRYLKIANDEDFFINTLEFPFFFEHNGIEILRAPTACTEDGSLVMTADIEENVNVRIAYGDPQTILRSVYSKAMSMRELAPEAITVFSCGARRTFWGDDEVGKETELFQFLAPTSGFYTSGEFLRTDGMVNQHNVTLVLCAVREGIPDETEIKPMLDDNNTFSRRTSMINRLANFIQASTEELEEANTRLERVAMLDGLTELLNRSEIQHRITRRSNVDKGKPSSLIMMDIDNFKSVNDNYGHKEGDNVLKMLSRLIEEIVCEEVPGGDAGRWGGEEFMILLPESDAEYAVKVAEHIRSEFSKLVFPKCDRRTISLGVTQMIPGESSDQSTMRADDALYQAKSNGKDQVVVK